MGAVSGSYGNLLQGVSKQPASNRAEGQCEEQINMFADPVTGLRKRPPTDFIAKLLDSRETDIAFHFYKASENEKYIFTLDPANDLHIFTLDGEEVEVHQTAEATEYLARSSLNGVVSVKDAYEMSTIGDITLLLNKTKVVGSTSANETPDMAISRDRNTVIEVRSGAFNTSFVLKDKSGVEIARYDSPRGDEVDVTSFDSRPEQVTLKLEESAIANGYGDLVRDGRYLIDTGNTILVAEDSMDAGYIRILAPQVAVIDNIDDLPKECINGKTVKVSPTGADDGDYYMRFVADENIDNNLAVVEGTWAEYRDPSGGFDFELTNMPLAIIRLPDGTFSCHTLYDGKVATVSPNGIGAGTAFIPEASYKYALRLVGDDKTNPLPVFVGKRINSLGFFQGRLYFLSGENITFSRSDDFLNFFYTTAVDIKSQDPIEFLSSTNKRNELVRAKGFYGDLVVTSDETQFIINGQQPLTPSTANITPVTNFALQNSTDPLAIGGVLMFPVNNGNYSGLREFYKDNVTATVTAEESTAYIDRYMEGRIVSMANSFETKTIVVVTDKADNGFYVQQYSYSGQTKQQNAWSRVELPIGFKVLWMTFDKGMLYIVAYNEFQDDIELLSLDGEDKPRVGLDYNVYLDRRQSFYVTGNQIVVDEYSEEHDVIQGNGCPYKGMRAEVESTTDNGDGTLTLNLKHLMNGEVFFGRKYKARYVPTRPFVKDSKGVPIQDGYLRVNRYVVSVVGSGYLSVLREDELEGDVRGIYNGRILGRDSNRVGEVNIDSATIKIPFLADAERAKVAIETDHHTPLILRDLEWEGTFQLNKRKL